jgi:hypothetical protein
MKRHSAFAGPVKNNNVGKYYILTRPAKLSDLTLDELEADEDTSGWREKSRQLQARRWRKLKHQLI